MQPNSVPTRQCAQAGFSILEVVVASAIMLVGLFGMAQLFIATTLLNAYSTYTSHSLTQAERTLESFKVAAATSTSQTAFDSTVTSSITEPAANATITARVEVYVLDNNGALIKPAGSSITLPTDLAALYGPNKTRAPSARSRLAIVRLTPSHADPKTNQVVTLVSTIEMKESF